MNTKRTYGFVVGRILVPQHYLFDPEVAEEVQKLTEICGGLTIQPDNTGMWVHPETKEVQQEAIAIIDCVVWESTRQDNARRQLVALAQLLLRQGETAVMLWDRNGAPLLVQQV